LATLLVLLVDQMTLVIVEKNASNMNRVLLMTQRLAARPAPFY
jgi:hypothetical protein